MTKILDDKSFRLSITLTCIFFGTGVVFLFLGLVEYSWILFGLLPIVLGVSIGALPNRKWGLIGAVMAAVMVLAGLLIAGASGFLCMIMSLPIIIPFIFLGSVITHLVRRYKDLKSTDNLAVLILPLIPFLIVAPTEQFLKTDKENIMDVRTEQIFNFSPEQVYDAIKSVDTLDAEKTFLMYFDLPIPTKCILEKEEIGGLRTCYFDAGNFSAYDFGAGTITERITELERGRILKMDVIDYTLVGRNWLGFKEAIYYFEKAGENQCKMTRVTTYTSVLTPRLYWEPLEKLGIQQEHEFVFRNLTKDLEIKYGR
ncbi:MAG: polyketide cyclase [Cytophagia bacterium]|nr:polyketide cyclase [Cytophagia bacterium]